MSWERRERGGRYYTRSRRENGRVVREYVGGGERGELFALLDAAKREDRAEARAAIDAERAAPLAIRERLTALSDDLDALVRATLVASGYHCHRGEWRRKRNGASRPHG